MFLANLIYENFVKTCNKFISRPDEIITDSHWPILKQHVAKTYIYHADDTVQVGPGPICSSAHCTVCTVQ